MGFDLTREMLTTKGDAGECWHALPATVCNKGQRERVAVKAKRRHSKGETRHEGWEGVLVSEVEAFRELASIGGIGEELLHK